MDKVRLGRTGLEVSRAGLGCGGHSRLGMRAGNDEAHATRVVEHALERGIDFLDTARAYGTEVAVGKAIQGRRERVVISTKSAAANADGPLSAETLCESLEKSLRRLDTDYVDLFCLHGVTAAQYPHAAEVLVPELVRQREAGKIRFLGLTEHFGSDTSHRMFARALPDDLFDVIMVGFNLLNPSARKHVFPLTQRNDVGTLIMFAVRRQLSRPEALVDAIAGLVADGSVPADALDPADPLGFLREHAGVDSIVEAAYRFCAHEPGANVVLTGTGSTAHLDQNLRAIAAPPLPDALQSRLRELFGELDSLSGN